MTDQSSAAASKPSPETQPTPRYMGIEIVVDITGRSQDEVRKAVETALCGACDTGERDCAIESMATCTHTDLLTVLKWVNGD